MQNDFGLWARYKRLIAVLEPNLSMTAAHDPDWRDSAEMLLLWSLNEEMLLSEVEADKRLRDKEELFNCILCCFGALETPDSFAQETQGGTVQGILGSKAIPETFDLHMTSANVELHRCIVQCFLASIARASADTQHDKSPASSGADNLATMTAGVCLCKCPRYPHEKLLCMHQISFHIVRALKFSISAANHERLCLWQFQCALNALREQKTQDGTMQNYLPAFFCVAAAKKELLRYLLRIKKHPASYFWCDASFFALAQEQIKGSIVQEENMGATASRSKPLGLQIRRQCIEVVYSCIRQCKRAESARASARIQDDKLPASSVASSIATMAAGFCLC